MGALSCMRIAGWLGDACRNCMFLKEVMISICIHMPCSCIRVPATSPKNDNSSSSFYWRLYALRVWSSPRLTPNKMFPSDPNKLNLLSSPKWTIDQFSALHTTCSSAKLIFWFFLLMRGLVTAEWAFSPHTETDPYLDQRWTGEQFQLQCWTNTLRISTLWRLIIHLSFVDGQPFGGN